ncbi:hypothetical protein BELL_0454g00030 [Botrytis elliptica]|uniref:Uncharacterized protein n=1 Tax=Botrytis elliptica TaxID=278938 RepID=A0A4Z1JFR5_9HELO|nr:hypothetical protein EAE99_011916 [Botrytis elliptica]TGO72448.1 hypothetical protein BELL_0454g00030 [Botrytis elliptica]
MDMNERRSSISGRIRNTSISLADAALNFNPQLGIWAATGTAIAYAPTLEELREPISGGANIEFNEQGHSKRTVTTDLNGEPVLAKASSRTQTRRLSNAQVLNPVPVVGHGNFNTALETEPKFAKPSLKTRTTVIEEERHGWGPAIKHGIAAFWKFATTPTGFLMTIYGLNIVAWGAMLFFLLLDAAPAMDHPDKDSNDSPRKKWLEIDSQILNALFCVTGFGLAPWRFRDLWNLLQVRFGKNKKAMKRLAKQNESWFRPGAWYTDSLRDENEENAVSIPATFTGEVAPPTSLWKLSFVVWMMVLNTLFQGVLAGFMWGYNRINRPSWATGTFIACGCAVSLFAGIMMWWEGRKVKKIEGPVIKVIEPDEKDTELVDHSNK